MEGAHRPEETKTQSVQVTQASPERRSRLSDQRNKSQNSQGSSDKRKILATPRRVNRGSKHGNSSNMEERSENLSKKSDWNITQV